MINFSKKQTALLDVQLLFLLKRPNGFSQRRIYLQQLEKNSISHLIIPSIPEQRKGAGRHLPAWGLYVITKTVSS